MSRASSHGWDLQHATNETCIAPRLAESSAQNMGQNQKWLPHLCLLGGPQVGENAPYLLYSRGSTAKGTKSKVATSPLPSRGPASGRKCYVTPAFSGVPSKGDKIFGRLRRHPIYGP